MIYTDYYSEIKNIKTGTKLWACAYEFDNNKITRGLIQKPVYGMARGYGWDYKEVTEEESYASFFVLFRNRICEIKSGILSSRVYADTYEECVESQIMKGIT